jgi:hypothetical protein
MRSTRQSTKTSKVPSSATTGKSGTLTDMSLQRLKKATEAEQMNKPITPAEDVLSLFAKLEARQKQQGSNRGCDHEK